MLKHQRELTLPRPTAAPTATSSAYFVTRQFLWRQAAAIAAAEVRGRYVLLAQKTEEAAAVLARKEAQLEQAVSKFCMSKFFMSKFLGASLFACKFLSIVSSWPALGFGRR